MKYDERPEAKTRIGKVLLDIKGDLNNTEARMMELQKKMKRNNLILTKTDKGDKIVVLDRSVYTKKEKIIYNGERIRAWANVEVPLIFILDNAGNAVWEGYFTPPNLYFCRQRG